MHPRSPALAAFAAALLLLVLSPSPASCAPVEEALLWGADGHKIIATLAESLVSPSTIARIRKILGNSTMADVASWADEVRYQAAYSWSAPLHYVDPFTDPLHGVCGYNNDRDCVDDFCVVEAIRNYSAQVVNPTLSPERQSDALKFTIHFCGDIHQPLHVCGIYTGGNSFSVQFYGAPTNLHSLWDTALPGRIITLGYGGSLPLFISHLLQRIDGEWASQVPSWLACPAEPVSPRSHGKPLPHELATRICPAHWATEIERINCDYVWLGISAGMNLEDTYFNHNKDIVEKLLAMGGVRLAGVLDEVFGMPVAAH